MSGKLQQNGSLPLPASAEPKIEQSKKQERMTDLKNHFVAAIGEFVGTTMFLFMAFGGTNVAGVGTDTNGLNVNQILFISLAFGFSLLVNVWVFFRVSGGLFNPAVSLGLALVGAITPARAVILVISQMIGGICGSALIYGLLPGRLNVRTTLSEGISISQGLFLEMFLTAMLMLTILLLAAEKNKATFLAPVAIGLALFICEMVGVYYTGGSLNPARSFGPNVVLGEFESSHWIYWLGPAMGSVLAVGFYLLMKAMHFEEVVPDQDATSDAQGDHQKHLIARKSKLSQKPSDGSHALGTHNDDSRSMATLYGNSVQAKHEPEPEEADGENLDPIYRRFDELDAKLDALLTQREHTAQQSISHRVKPADKDVSNDEKLEQRVDFGDAGREKDGTSTLLGRPYKVE
ncbi:mip family channel protein [Phaffia rhodozyma]|uniref:Mip family channel protein n=1 Tax=Phaffia rhodozyma TaxID=264483 RepID=A0A0F7SP85_PHARH|nr:mip family channel protein [Phaffia rhodozyma]